MAERYYLENWLRGVKNDILDGRFEDLDSSHPHITFVRPFIIPPGDEEMVKGVIIDYCKDKKPIGFKLKGVSYFPNGINYIPVYSQELLEFNNGLEEVLEGHVIFDEKLADEKTLHLTVTAGGMEEFPEKDFVMLRLTCIKNKKILFSYDLEMGRVLNREQSLDRWHWRFTRALYEDRLEPGIKRDLRREIIESISDFEGDPEYFDREYREKNAKFPGMTEKEDIPIDGFLNLSMNERFSIVRKLSDQVEVGKSLLPEKIFLGIESEEEGKGLYDVAVNLWEDVFREEEFVETLTQISQNPASYTPEVSQRLKMTRIGQVILRDANRLLSESHLNSGTFYNFAKILGIFNDNFGTNIAEPLVSDVLVAMRKSQEEDISRKFIPCLPVSFESYLKTEKDLIVSYLDREELPMEILHDLRRTNRRFLNFFLLKTLKNSDMESFRIYAYLRKVNTVLGECLDERRRTDRENQVSEDLIKIPQVVRELILEFQARVV